MKRPWDPSVEMAMKPGTSGRPVARALLSSCGDPLLGTECLEKSGALWGRGRGSGDSLTL